MYKRKKLTPSQGILKKAKTKSHRPGANPTRQTLESHQDLSADGLLTGFHRKSCHPEALTTFGLNVPPSSTYLTGPSFGSTGLPRIFSPSSDNAYFLTSMSVMVLACGKRCAASGEVDTCA